MMIAMALACKPDVLIADEPTTALDVTVQKQILALIGELVTERGMALVLISHDLGLVAQNVRRMLVMYGGSVVESGSADEVFKHPAHPYTRGLLAAPQPGAAPARPPQRPPAHHCRHRARPVRPAVRLPLAGRCPFTEEPACSRDAPPGSSSRPPTPSSAGAPRWCLMLPIQ
jgi:peptide/nickel transport system ATP-binding protein